MKDRIVAIETEYGIEPPQGIETPTTFVFTMPEFSGLLGNNNQGKFIANGAQVYKDQTEKPEYAAPECVGPTAASLYDLAGQRIMHEIFKDSNYRLYRLNRDKDGNYLGSHENYSVDPSVVQGTRLGMLVSFLAPFIITRQIFAGAGYFQDGNFKISQRSDCIFMLTGGTTTNTRDIVNMQRLGESYSDKYQRLHIISGDSNMCEFPNTLKLATTCMVIDMAEERYDIPVEIEDPVFSIRNISNHKDKSGWLTNTKNGKRIDAIDIQRLYLEISRRHYGSPDVATKLYLDEWERVLDGLERDPMSLVGELEWPTKRQMLEYAPADKQEWADVEWHNIDPDKGIYHIWKDEGLVRTCFTDRMTEKASTEPPRDTRAYFRGEMVRRLPADVQTKVPIGWDCIGSLKMPDPFDTYEDHMGDMDGLISELLYIPPAPNYNHG